MDGSLMLLAESEGLIAGLFGLIFTLLWIGLVVALIAGMWKVFEKAGKPGWAAIVPIYNAIVILEIVGRPTWWILLMFIPCLSIIFSIIVMIDLAKSFGKDALFGIGLIFLSFIFIPILGFGSARYEGPAAS